MAERRKIRAREAGEMLAGAGMSAREATIRFRAWKAMGIIPVAGRAGDRSDARDSFLFDESGVAIAAVLFWAYDHGGIRKRAHLRQIWEFLSADAGSGVPTIDHVLGAVFNGGSPMLVLTRWGDGSGDVATSCVLRFDDEYERPIEGPTPDHLPLADVVLDLAKHLARFVESGALSVAAQEAVH